MRTICLMTTGAMFGNLIVQGGLKYGIGVWLPGLIGFVSFLGFVIVEGLRREYRIKK